MPIRDILLPLVGNADAAAMAAIEKCAAVAGDIGIRVTAIAVENQVVVRPRVTISSDLENSAAAEAVRSVSSAHSLLQAFDAAANRFGVRNEQRLSRLADADISAHFSRSARLKDLSLVPVRAHDSQSEKVVETLIFESGRPILICPEEFAAELPVAFDNVLIAWDHSAPAARAVADTLSRLQAAASVRIVTATDARTPAEQGIRTCACEPSRGTRYKRYVRNGEDRRQFDRKGV
jgi:hypothetical protein